MGWRKGLAKGRAAETFPAPGPETPRGKSARKEVPVRAQLHSHAPLPRCPHPLPLPSVPASALGSTPPERSPHSPSPTKQHYAPPPAPAGPRLRPAGSLRARVPERAPAPAPAPPAAHGRRARLHARGERRGPAPPGASPLPASRPECREGHGRRAGGRVNRFGAAPAATRGRGRGRGLTGMSTRSDRRFWLGFFLPLLPPGLETSFFFLVSMAALPITLTRS